MRAGHSPSLCGVQLLYFNFGGCLIGCIGALYGVWSLHVLGQALENLGFKLVGVTEI